MILAVAACTTTETIYVNQLVYADANASNTEDSTALPADAVAIDASAPHDAQLQAPAGCTEIFPTKVENGTMFASRARWGGYGTRLRMAMPVSPFAELPTVGLSVGLDHPLPLPVGGVPVVAPIGTPDANKRRSVNYGFGGFSSADGTKTAYFVARSGRVTLTAANNEEQIAGSIDDMALVEVEFSVEGNGDSDTRPVPGARCLYLRHIDFDTRVANGCNPELPLSCGQGKTCSALNLAASDGVCVETAGTIADGAPCSEDPITGANGCMQGSACWSYPVPDQNGVDVAVGPKCVKRCNQFAPHASSGCGAREVCGGYGFCRPDTETPTGRYRPDIRIGESCGNLNGYSFETRADCDGKLGPLGFCYDPDDDGPIESACRQFVRGRGECARMGMASGTRGDLVWCFPAKPTLWMTPVAPDASAPSDGGDAQ